MSRPSCNFKIVDQASTLSSKNIEKVSSTWAARLTPASTLYTLMNKEFKHIKLFSLRPSLSAEF
jgi:hypothetical protein